MAPVRIGTRTVISQRAFLCAGTHDILDPHFQLQARAITIADDVWISAEAFVAPGVKIFDGGILGARACAFTDVQAWTVYRGNPAVPYKKRIWPSGEASDSEAQ
jgi:putative colanic acid biosynthesis acetyltransferase WcaF